MKIELPWPDAKLNPNRSKGVHWASTSGLRKKARADAYVITRAAFSQGARVSTGESGRLMVSLDITFVQPDKRARDRDNLLAALKPSLDGVADALGLNDSEFDPVVIRRAYGSKPGRVIMEIG